MPKIIQIAATATEKTDIVYALDDAGNLWEGWYEVAGTSYRKFEWRELPPLPDENEGK